IKTKTLAPDGLTIRTSTLAKIITSGARAMRNDCFSFRYIAAIRRPIRPCPISITKTLSSRAPVTGSYRVTTFKISSPSKQRERQCLLVEPSPVILRTFYEDLSTFYFIIFTSNFSGAHGRGGNIGDPRISQGGAFSGGSVCSSRDRGSRRK